jgi:hypothetical protein
MMYAWSGVWPGRERDRETMMITQGLTVDLAEIDAVLESSRREDGEVDARRANRRVAQVIYDALSRAGVAGVRVDTYTASGTVYVYVGARKLRISDHDANATFGDAIGDIRTDYTVETIHEQIAEAMTAVQA